MVSDGKMNRLLLQQDPGALQETLDMIARSDPVDDVAENGQFIETHQPQIAIDDLM